MPGRENDASYPPPHTSRATFTQPSAYIEVAGVTAPQTFPKTQSRGLRMPLRPLHLCIKDRRRCEACEYLKKRPSARGKGCEAGAARRCAYKERITHGGPWPAVCPNARKDPT